MKIAENERGLLLTADRSLLIFFFVQIGERLIRFRSRRRAISEHGHLFQAFQAGTGPDMNEQRLGG